MKVSYSVLVEMNDAERLAIVSALRVARERYSELNEHQDDKETVATLEAALCYPTPPHKVL